MSATAAEPKQQAGNTDLEKTGKEFFGEQKPVKGTTEDFLKKFAPPSLTEGQDKAGESQSPGQKTEGDGDGEGEDGEGKVIVDDKVEKKTKPFIKRILEDRDSLKKQNEELSKEREASTNRIKELEAQLGNADTAKEFKEIQEKLNKEIQARSELESNSSKKIQELESRLEFYSLQESPAFIEGYIKPIQEKHRAIVELIGSNQDLAQGWEAVKSANERIYSARNDKERQEAIRSRDSAVEELSAVMPQWMSFRFFPALDSYFKAGENLNNKLRNWQQTKKELTVQAQKEAQRAREDFLKGWHTSYKDQGEKVDSDSAIPEEIASYMQENKIDFDLSRDETIALLATQQGEGEASVEDTNRLIHQGRVYSKLKTALSAASKIIAEQKQYIEKLKAGSRVEDAGRRSSQSGEAAKDLNGFLSKFGPR